jgi:hypothetical protein
MLTRTVRWLFPLALCAGLLAGGPRALSAQDTVPAPTSVPAPDSGGGAVIQENTSGLYLEWSLVAIAVGVAVFAVCRSSRRN